MELKFRRNPAYQSLREEMTPEGMFMDRRHVLSAAGFIGAGSILGALPACSEPQQTPAPVAAGAGGHPAPGAALKAKKAAYAVATAWCGTRCVTAYVGHVKFGRPVRSGELVEVTAKLIHTGRSRQDLHATMNVAQMRVELLDFATALAGIWGARDDRYSELRTSLPGARGPRVEMSYIGG